MGIGLGLGVALAAPAFAASRLPDSAGPAVAPPPVVVTTAVSGPTNAALMPLSVTAHQVSIRLNATQLRNAAAIVTAAREMHLPPRAAVIAVATALQESKLHNYGNLGRRNDHDSLGLFQQRPSCGWGTPTQVTNPDHAAKAFLSRLVRIGNWNTIPLTVAAQKVQVSAFGSRYAQWETEAASIVRSDYAA